MHLKNKIYIILSIFLFLFLINCNRSFATSLDFPVSFSNSNYTFETGIDLSNKNYLLFTYYSSFSESDIFYLIYSDNFIYVTLFDEQNDEHFVTNFNSNNTPEYSGGEYIIYSVTQERVDYSGGGNSGNSLHNVPLSNLTSFQSNGNYFIDTSRLPSDTDINLSLFRSAGGQSGSNGGSSSSGNVTTNTTNTTSGNGTGNNNTSNTTNTSVNNSVSDNSSEDDSGNLLSRIFSTIGNIFTGIGNIFSSITSFFGSLLDKLNPLSENWILLDVISALRNIFSYLNPVSSDNIYIRIGNIFSGLFSFLGSFFSNLADFFLHLVVPTESQWNSIKSDLSDLKTSILNHIPMWSFIQSTITDAQNTNIVPNDFLVIRFPRFQAFGLFQGNSNEQVEINVLQTYEPYRVQVRGLLLFLVIVSSFVYIIKLVTKYSANQAGSYSGDSANNKD